ncbi:MAG: hypothetical protein L3J20_00170 [Flavobacteriaceae bacterium]|nr:hypothetical protein [Flavobacteriaceae bacterium]
MKHIVNIPKPFRFSGVLAKVIFFFKKAKSSTIAFVMVLFFNTFKGRKNESKNRKTVWFGYMFLILICNSVFSQNQINSEKFKQLEPSILLGIWDKENSDKSIKIDSLSYDDIPKYLNFRGIVIEALKWTDSLGENILVQSVTGRFNWKNYHKDSTSYIIQDKSELYVYLFQKKKREKKFTEKWKIYDYNECFGVDWYTGFIQKATTITDVNNDGITEISIPYVLICRGGMDPGIMKIIMYENNTKYALTGSTMFCIGEDSYGGKFRPSENLVNNKKLKDFLTKRWNIHKCENKRSY